MALAYLQRMCMKVQNVHHPGYFLSGFAIVHLVQRFFQQCECQAGRCTRDSLLQLRRTHAHTHTGSFYLTCGISGRCIGGHAHPGSIDSHMWIDTCCLKYLGQHCATYLCACTCLGDCTSVVTADELLVCRCFAYTCILTLHDMDIRLCSRDGYPTAT